MLSELRVGPIVAADGTVQPARQDRTGSIITADAHGRYAEAARRGRVFYAASQAATTWSVALNTTHTGLVVANPAGSGVNLEMLAVSFAWSVAPVAIAHMGIFGGFLAAGITVHTTPLTPASTLIGNTAGVAKASGAATLVGTPVWLGALQGGFTAGALPAGPSAYTDLGGMFVVPPGGYFGIGALTAVIGFASASWEEVAI